MFAQRACADVMMVGQAHDAINDHATLGATIMANARTGPVSARKVGTGDTAHYVSYEQMRVKAV